MSFAFGYSVVASIISLAGGALGSGETRGMLVRVIVAYFLAGAGAGFVVGLMRQRMKTTAEVRIASMAAGVPAWAAVGTVSFERIPYEWDQAAWMSYGACVLLYGPIIGLLQRRRLRRYVGSGSLGC